MKAKRILTTVLMAATILTIAVAPAHAVLNTYWAATMAAGAGRNDAVAGYGLGYRYSARITHNGGGWSNYVKSYDGPGAPDVTQLTTTGSPNIWVNPIPGANVHAGCINQNSLNIYAICQFSN